MPTRNNSRIQELQEINIFAEAAAEAAARRRAATSTNHRVQIPSPSLTVYTKKPKSKVEMPWSSKHPRHTHPESLQRTIRGRIELKTVHGYKEGPDRVIMKNKTKPILKRVKPKLVKKSTIARGRPEKPGVRLTNEKPPKTLTAAQKREFDYRFEKLMKSPPRKNKAL